MKRIDAQTLYEILEVPRDASPAAIRAAVDRAREMYGPGSLATYSLISPEETADLARRIDEAEQTLLDADLRALYDEEIAHPEAREAAGGTSAPSAPTAPWPPPPVIPARREPPRELAEPREPARDPAGDAPGRSDADDEFDEGEDEHELEAEVNDAAPLPAAEPPPPAARSPRPEGEAPVAAPPPAPAPRAPILLSREVAPASAPPAAPPPPPAAAQPPVAPAPTPPPAAAGPIATPVPMVPVAPQPPAPDTTLWTGEVLRRLREARGITLAQLSERTKVTRHHIENIEGDRFGLLPAPVYLRGILLSIARELRLDGQKVARSYLERFTGGGGAPPAGPARSR